jgi:hypothetical protein
MPQGEELVPETPTDAIGRYVLVLRQWEDLTRRQAKYEDDLRKLHATGDALSAEWESLAAERQHVVEELGALDTRSHEVIERAWTLFKAHLFALILHAEKGAIGRGMPTPACRAGDPQPTDQRVRCTT